ncbi:MAG: DUF3147 domain-containing protein [Nitrospiraceae bacterium]|nr:DUF3147 domain-containing protein [Nitrospiraceae bacterium]MDA8325011.1 DUF3147 domain-containing protein [Nitrospiraceae bacterium]
MTLKYLLYFLLGGTVVSLVTYLASHSRGLMAAFFANMPTITAITFLTIYLESGPAAVVPYATALVLMLFPWLIYIFSIIFLTPRLGFAAALILGILFYFIVALGMVAAKRF